MEPRALDLLNQRLSSSCVLLVAFNNPESLVREPEAGACYAPFLTVGDHGSPNSFFFFLQRQGWGSLCLSPRSAHLLTTSLRVSPQLRLGCLLTAVFWGSPLCQPSPGCLPASCRARRGTKYHFLLAPAPGRRDGDLPGFNTQLYVNTPKQLLDIRGRAGTPALNVLETWWGHPCPQVL